MNKLSSFISIIFASLVLASCSSSDKNEFEGIPEQELYNKGQAYLQDGNYNSAIRHLEALSTQSHSMLGEQIELSLIYANYKLGEYHKALIDAERFVRVYPNSASMDYVYYLAALSNARLSDNFVQDFFKVSNAQRAVDAVRNAYGSFQTLIQHFPQSQYRQEAEQWSAYLLNRLAEHELAIAKFYMKRDAYVAVSNRIQNMMQLYPNSKATYEALPLLQESFEKMGIHDSAQKITVLIEAGRAKQFKNIKKPEYGEKF
ncbi:Beta-barrel assembly machine subunit BamD [Nicoletella semolina]|uniref:Outer membrane protein assembly factor BamD n=1 Tax=Nicoletella semolina TaxID=271160 RepID=A0A4R2NCM1_9PAST|nr:outer membrane protein assembly factor BamD [Nicoletella semolina]MDH2924242.1 outer membrane assembly protein BamD [Nicoletella semolina]TCP18860.1 Beta-barrel assembly machine subunit BamD [Nicoletella semolina]